MKTLNLPRKELVVLERDRQDYGDVEELADSIERYGLLQPIVINQQHQLIAGGRRLAAIDKLGWEEIPCVLHETLDEAELAELETEENVRRKNYNWQEMIRATCRLHRLHARRAALAGEEWTLAMTGAIIGFSQTFVWNALDLLDDIEKEEFKNCEGITDAVRLKARLREDAARQELLRRTTLAKLALTPTAAEPMPEASPTVFEPLPKTDAITVDMSKKLFHADMLELLPTWPPGICDHIITDPPYGIDVEMMQQSSEALMDTSRVENTHDVSENIGTFRKMFPLLYRAMKDEGFCVLWCDITQWQLLFDEATKVGFRVQRWPLIWHKLSQCKCQMAHQLFTKNFEIAMVCRKGNATLPDPVQTSVITAHNLIGDEKRSNPFAKPFDVWKFIIESVSYRGQVILDPFAGEGSCTLATMQLYRSPLAIEKDINHYPYLVETFKQFWTTGPFKEVNFI